MLGLRNSMYKNLFSGYNFQNAERKAKGFTRTPSLTTSNLNGNGAGVLKWSHGCCGENAAELDGLNAE